MADTVRKYSIITIIINAKYIKLRRKVCNLYHNIIMSRRMSHICSFYYSVS